MGPLYVSTPCGPLGPENWPQSTYLNTFSFIVNLALVDSLRNIDFISAGIVASV